MYCPPTNRLVGICALRLRHLCFPVTMLAAFVRFCRPNKMVSRQHTLHLKGAKCNLILPPQSHRRSPAITGHPACWCSELLSAMSTVVALAGRRSRLLSAVALGSPFFPQRAWLPLSQEDQPVKILRRHRPAVNPTVAAAKPIYANVGK